MVIIYICILLALKVLPGILPSLRAAFVPARTALASGSVTETAFFQDQVGSVRHEEVLQSGLRRFYEETGVQPFVYFTKDVNFYFDSYEKLLVDEQDPLIDTSRYNSSMARMEALYDTLFEDEGHFLLVVIGDSTYGKTGLYLSYYYGDLVDQVMDDDAVDILFDYYDRYIDTSRTIENVISTSFGKTADNIMGITAQRMKYIFCVAAVVIAAGIVFAVLKTRQNRKAIKDFNERYKGEGAKNSIMHDDLVLDEPKMPARTVSSKHVKKEKEDAGKTISWEEALQDMGLADEQLAHLESAEELEHQPEKTPAQPITETAATLGYDRAEDALLRQQSEVDDFWKTSEVDWGFSLEEGIDLFKDEKK
jgi:hypothetical protein